MGAQIPLGITQLFDKLETRNVDEGHPNKLAVNLPDSK